MKRIDLSLSIPPDKSSLIREYLFSLLTDEPVFAYYSEYLPLDIKTAFKCLKKFGKKTEIKDAAVLISGIAEKPEEEIDCENSATVMHIIMGIAALKKWKIKLTGDRSLMKRDHSGFVEAGKFYKNCFIETELTRESAQLKSFHLIAMLKNGGKLKFRSETRRNTEELLKIMGAEIIESKNLIEVNPVEKLNGYDLKLKLDPSSAFIACCFACVLKKPFIISNIYPEKLRMEPFRFLKKAGYDISVILKDECFEVKGDGKFRKKISKINILPNEVPKIIDEIPFLVYMSARVGIQFEIENGQWLRNKESDRIKGTVERMSPFFEIFEKENGLISGMEKKETVAKLPHSDDHRMEMLSKLIAVDKNISFETNDCYNVSFPGFLRTIEALGVK